MHYNHLRYYDPDAGRLISHYPIGLLGGDNQFQYAPNPIGWIDPWGLKKSKNNTCIDGMGNTVDVSDLGIPGGDFKPNPKITKPYSRPIGTTSAQRASVQGKACVVCGNIHIRMIADHIDPLVVQFYRDGQVDIVGQKKVSAVQPHCGDCSPSQGGEASVFSRNMKKELGL